MPKEEPEQIDLLSFVEKRIDIVKKAAVNRAINYHITGDKNRIVNLPGQVLAKIITGLVKNAVENTPDQGTIKVSVKADGERTVLTIKDYGVGIQEEYHQRIFEGFFPTQKMTAYSTGKPYEFNAGGRGADLLRMKIFSERFNFTIGLESTRCVYLKDDMYTCPGQIRLCEKCNDVDDCDISGSTELILVF